MKIIILDRNDFKNNGEGLSWDSLLEMLELPSNTDTVTLSAKVIGENQ